MAMSGGPRPALVNREPGDLPSSREPQPLGGVHQGWETITMTNILNAVPSNGRLA
jgi:hypothetical protein